MPGLDKGHVPPTCPLAARAARSLVKNSFSTAHKCVSSENKEVWERGVVGNSLCGP